jgi:hypothetical protein
MDPRYFVVTMSAEEAGEVVMGDWLEQMIAWLIAAELPEHRVVESRASTSEEECIKSASAPGK